MAIIQALQSLVGQTAAPDKKEEYIDSDAKVDNAVEADCKLLDMPCDVLLGIAKYLEPQDKIMFSYTCWDMQSLFCITDCISRMDKNQHLRYLATLAFGDTPAQIDEIHCPKSQRWLLHGFEVFKLHRYKLGHRHVQLALKSSRLDAQTNSQQKHIESVKLPASDHQKYIQTLLKTYHGRTRFPSGPFYGNQSARHTVQPVITEGNFLVSSTWTIGGWFLPLNIWDLGQLSICCHQELWDTNKLAYRLSSGSGGQGVHLLEYNAQVSPVDMQSDCEFSKSIFTALCFRKLVAKSHCDKCPVDFEVRATKSSLTIQAWYDFGREGTIEDECWSALRSIPHEEGPKYLQGRISHKAGSIRERFERCAEGKK